MKKIKIYLNKNFLKLVSLKKWYAATYPDEQDIINGLNDVTFNDILTSLEKGKGFYKVAGPASDTVVRERFFNQLVLYTNDLNTYEDFYQLWLQSENG
jgi:hypothetical protein